MMNKKEKEAFQTVYDWYMEEKRRLDFIDMLLQSGLPVGFKPGYKVLVGTVYTEGAQDVRELIDKIIRINNGEGEEVIDASSSDNSKEESSTNIKDQG
jgi:hypothetical protein